MSEMIPSLESLVKDFSQFRKAYAKLYFPHLANYGLSPCEIDILIFLSNNPNVHTAKELTIYLGVAKSLVARSVDNLLRKNLLCVELDKKDRRIQQLSLSLKSNELVVYIKEKQIEFSALVTNGIDPEELTRIATVLTQINKNIEILLKGEVKK